MCIVQKNVDNCARESCLLGLCIVDYTGIVYVCCALGRMCVLCPGTMSIVSVNLTCEWYPGTVCILSENYVYRDQESCLLCPEVMCIVFGKLFTLSY